MPRGGEEAGEASLGMILSFSPRVMGNRRGVWRRLTWSDFGLTKITLTAVCWVGLTGGETCLGLGEDKGGLDHFGG